MLKAFYREAKSVFASASMNLREWGSNSKDFMKFIPHENQAARFELKVLGIKWNLIDDTLSIPCPSIGDANNAWTKWKVLQVISSVFGPLGYFSQPF